jgi:hypothetical protein
MEPLELRRLLAVVGVIGDYTAGTPLRDVSNLIKSWNPDYIATVGDNWYSDPSIDDSVGQYFHDYISPYSGSYGAGSTSGNRFWPTLGNHDYENGVSQYLNFFTLPNNERYYSVKKDNIELFVINSNTQEANGTSSTSTQATWLKNGLAASTATFKLVLFHHPAYTSGTEGNNTRMQWPFQQWGASAVISGHDHIYERILKNGFPYFVNGLGGAEIVPAKRTESGSQIRYWSNYGAMRIESSSTQLNFKFYNRSGTLIDNYTINAATPPPTGTAFTAIATGTSWKYLDNGTNQGTAWRALSFDDSTWKSGNAELGYGDGDEATVVGFGGSSSNKFVTTYFRKSFNIADRSAVTSLNLRIKRDDGAVVYLNGAEVYRTNMTAGTVAYNTFASSTTEDNNYYTASISPSLLNTGNNVIAVEIHQSDAGSSDISFNFDLTGTSSGPSAPTAPAAPASLTAAAPSATQVNLGWSDQSNNETGFKIERSTDGTNFTEIATVAAGMTTYGDTGRTASTRYYYRVCAYNSVGNSAYSNVASALTSDTSGAVYLSDLAWVSATNGYGPVEKDMGNGSSGAGDGAPITLNGVVYTKGLGAHANSSIVYNLNGAYNTFISDVGVDDRQATNGTIVFQVYLDNVLAYDSGVMRATTVTKNINLSVAGKTQLRLVITDSGDGIDYDHGDWAGARLTPIAPAARVASATVAPHTTFSSLEISALESLEEEHVLELI